MNRVRPRPAAGFGDFLARTFPNIDPARLLPRVDPYRTHGMWTTPRMDADAFDRWQGGIAAGHLVAAPVAYHDLIDIRPLAGLPE